MLTSGAVGVVSNTSLSYSNGPVTVDGGTNAIYVANPDKTVFTRAIGTQNGDSLYLSFLFQTPTADGNSEDFFSFGPNSATAETSAGVIHRLNSSNSDHDFGIRYGTTDKRGTGGTETGRARKTWWPTVPRGTSSCAASARAGCSPPSTARP